ncbi:hypothetical protein [Domibacillus iocasae]|uniref:hypothetical protein n=1 Tax=Domibacillus iocasae TaxID=1714016 RepID=UPI0014711A9A|nr:hypothetical protein [Domibacillus iocasae]
MDYLKHFSPVMATLLMIAYYLLKNFYTQEQKNATYTYKFNIEITHCSSYQVRKET